ncbi:MAG TPA: hypothetical protein VFP84_19475 [Kofleriaceae bacterium]|nr:hypothetical protein [Kofleriaceae bacterium]
MTSEPPSGLTEELIEKMRTIGLRLDRAGVFWHEGTEVSHPRLRQALLRWLAVRADGRDVVKLDDKRYAYVEIEDAHLRALSARWDGDRCFVRWDDDQESELDYASLRQAADHAFYVRVRDRLRGRIAGPAYHAVAERAVEVTATEEHPGGFALAAAGKHWPIENAA